MRHLAFLIYIFPKSILIEQLLEQEPWIKCCLEKKNQLKIFWRYYPFNMSLKFWSHRRDPNDKYLSIVVGSILQKCSHCRHLTFPLWSRNFTILCGWKCKLSMSTLVFFPPGFEIIPKLLFQIIITRTLSGHKWTPHSQGQLLVKF